MGLNVDVRDTLNAEWWRLLRALRKTSTPDEGRWNGHFIHALDLALKPVFNTYFRAFTTGMNNIPDGRAVFVGVHGGGLMSPDLLLAGAAFHRHTRYTRPLYGMAHRILFSFPVFNVLLQAIGGVEGNRPNAIRLLNDDQAIIVFPGGEYDMSRTFRRRNEVRFSGRTGFVKVALEANAPIVPFGSVGGHGIFITLTEGRRAAKLLNLKKWFDVSTFPVCISLPWGISVTWMPCLPLPSHLGVAFGKPMYFNPTAAQKEDRGYLAAVRDEVEREVQRLNLELLEGIGRPSLGVAKIPRAA